MKEFRILYASGKMSIIKADEYEMLTQNGPVQVAFRIKGYGIVMRANWNHVECIEEVIENE